MNKTLRFTGIVAIIIVLALTMLLAASIAYADDGTGEAVQGFDKGLASGIAIGLAAMGGGLGMGIATGKSAEGISRQPEAEGKIRSTFMLGLVFIETAIIYALLVVILIIFVI